MQGFHFAEELLRASSADSLPVASTTRTPHSRHWVFLPLGPGTTRLMEPNQGWPSAGERQPPGNENKEQMFARIKPQDIGIAVTAAKLTDTAAVAVLSPFYG